MPSQKKQYNIRLSDADGAEVERLRLAISSSAGGLDVSVTDVFVVALKELSRRYPPGTEAPEPHPKHRGRPRKPKPPGPANA